MKKVLLTLLVLNPYYLFAQNFQNDGGKYDVYCDVMYFMSIKNRVNITINKQEYDIVSENGEIINTKEGTEALNLLSKRGWKLVSSSQSLNGTSGSIHFIMKKEVTNDNEIETGIKIKK